MHLTMLWIIWNLFVRYLTRTYSLITMNCTLVFDNGKSSGWERKGRTVANGSPALFKHKHVPSKFIYVKKSTYYRLMMRDLSYFNTVCASLCRIQTHTLPMIRVVIQCGTAL